MFVTQVFRTQLIKRLTHQFAVKKFNLPDLGQKIKEGKIEKWYVKAGDKVEEYQKLADITSDKQFTELTASDTGKITQLFHQQGQLCQVGEPLFEIDVKEDGKSSTDQIKESKNQSDQKAIKEQQIQNNNTSSVQSNNHLSDNSILATPAIRHLLKTHNIDISQIKGSGKDQRILREDVLKYIENKDKPKTTQAQTKRPINTGPLIKKLIQMNNYDKGMQKTMSASNNIPHLSYHEQFDLTQLMQFRQKSKNTIKDKITYMSYFIKSFSLALNDYPRMNALYYPENPFEYHIVQNHNITVAIDSPNGLAVPNIKNVQNLSIVEVQRQLNRLRKAAQDGKIERKDIEGGTISISNIGTVGGTYARPLILPPQVAIVALGKTRLQPRYLSEKSTEVVARNIMPVSFSADHRVIDGGTVANFSNKWKQYLENPSAILLQLR